MQFERRILISLGKIKVQSESLFKSEDTHQLSHFGKDSGRSTVLLHSPAGAGGEERAAWENPEGAGRQRGLLRGQTQTQPLHHTVTIWPSFLRQACFSSPWKFLSLGEPARERTADHVFERTAMKAGGRQNTREGEGREEAGREPDGLSLCPLQWAGPCTTGARMGDFSGT